MATAKRSAAEESVVTEEIRGITIEKGPNFGPPVAITFASDFSLGNGDRSSDMGRFEPSLTRQEFAEECDINTIMAQYEKTGVISHLDPREPMYLDLTNMPDLGTALSIMNDATAAFMSLPAKVRKEFDNDPVEFVKFAEKPENVEKMREWGLAPPKAPPPEPQLVRVVPDLEVSPASPADASKPA